MVQDFTGVIGIVGVIVGVILGFLLNIVKEWYNNKNQTQSIKLLINYEIDHNMKLIEDFVKEINEISIENEEEKPHNLENIPLPPLNNGMYNKFALFLPNSVSEFEKLYEFYRNLDDFKFKYNKMILILTKDNSIVIHWVSPEVPDEVRPGKMPQSDEILLNELWNEFEETIDKLLNNGITIKKIGSEF